MSDSTAGHGGALASVLVTGASSGIGAALAPMLAERGCQVLAAGRDTARLDAVAGASPSIIPVAGAVTDPDHQADLASRLAELPGARGVVHLAGYFQTGMLDRLSVEDWHRSLAVNVEARWALSTACAEALDGGRVLFIGSDAGANPRVGAGAYSIAQSASETLRRVLQAEWQDTNRAVGGFKPGLVDTEMVRGFMRAPESEFPARRAYDEYVDSGRIASAESVARFITWLLLDVTTDEFVETDWDVRDTEHHERWSTGPLYPDAI